MVNEIKSTALNTRLFRLLCQVLDENHEELLFHTEVRWLSRGNMLSRVESLNEDTKTLQLTDPEWLVKLAYSSDIFNCLNELNKSPQGSHTTL